MYSTPLILSSTMGKSLEGCGSDLGRGRRVESMTSWLGEAWSIHTKAREMGVA